jgi:hypothetical protein
MKYHIQIEMENDAFACDQEAEITRILKGLIKNINIYGRVNNWPLYDINGNRVGMAEVIK